MKWLPPVVLGYGVIMIGLGLFSYLRHPDTGLMSLIGGGAIGVLAIIGAAVAKSWPMIGYGIAGLATFAAMGRFAKPFFSEGKLYPAGLIFTLSAITFLCLVVGHFMARRQPTLPVGGTQQQSDKNQ